MFSAVGRYEPRRPSGARRSTIVGTRASAPISAAEPEHQVADDRCGDDRRERDRQRQREPELVGGEHEERAGDDHEQRDGRFDQRRSPSSSPSTRRRSGTGSMPQDGVSFGVTALPSPA